MILADKLIWLRKKNGLSQEEFAEKIDVSRQAVSRWEGAQTYPDLPKIILISKLFDVSTDYLLIDDIEDENKSSDKVVAAGEGGLSNEEIPTEAKEIDPDKHVLTKEEVDGYLSASEKYGKRCALSSILITLSLLPLIVISVYVRFFRDAALALSLGVIGFIVLAAAGCCILFIKNGELGRYRYILSEPFCYENVLKEQIMIKKYKFIPYYNAFVATSVVLMSGAVAVGVSLWMTGAMLPGVSLMVVGTAVVVSIMVYSVIRLNSYKNLLEKGRNTKLNKARTTVLVSAACWFVLIELSLCYLFMGMYDGDFKYVVPIMVAITLVIYIICLTISGIIEKKRNKNLRS